MKKPILDCPKCEPDLLREKGRSMIDGQKALTLILPEGTSDDEAEALILAIRQLDGVIDVSLSEENCKEAHSQSEETPAGSTPAVSAPVGDIPLATCSKLTAAQKHVLKTLVHGWRAIRNGKSFLYVNGKRFCKIEDMLALKDMGLVGFEIDGDDWAWQISEAGRLIGEKL